MPAQYNLKSFGGRVNSEHRLVLGRIVEADKCQDLMLFFCSHLAHRFWLVLVNSVPCERKPVSGLFKLIWRETQRSPIIEFLALVERPVLHRVADVPESHGDVCER